MSLEKSGSPQGTPQKISEITEKRKTTAIVSLRCFHAAHAFETHAFADPLYCAAHNKVIGYSE